MTFENKPQLGTLSLYGFLKQEYTLFAVYRRPGMPTGYTMRDMGNDYAAMIREEFGGPVDVIGISTGGSIALHFAADHPGLVRRLVVHSSAHTLNDAAKALHRDVARLAQQGEWRQAWSALISTVFPQKGAGRWLAYPFVGLSAWLLSRKPPRDAGDLVATVEAEDQHAFTLATVGGSMTSRALRTMDGALLTWGYHLVGRTGLRMGALAALRELPRFEPRAQKAAEKLFRAVADQHALAPAFVSLMVFRIQQLVWSREPVGSHDRAYWQANGWLSPGCAFYLPHRANPVRVVLARLTGAIVHRLVT